MPARYRRPAKKYGNKRRPMSIARRRLQPGSAGGGVRGGAKRFKSTYARSSSIRNFPYRVSSSVTEPLGMHGKAPADASSGAKGGFFVGKKKRMVSVIKKRKQAIMNAIADARYPIIKDKQLQATTQLDWDAGTQGVIVLNAGYVASELEGMVAQAASAQSVSTASLVATIPANNLNANQKMDIYDKITRINFKNTCSHTVYLEIHAFIAASYHTFSVLESWQTALVNDNMNQNSATFGTEMVLNNLTARPDMRMPHLNVRWSKRKDAVRKITLEPGQETHYTYVQKGGRFDMAKWNVLVGGTGTTLDATYVKGLTSQLLIFGRSEMITDAVSTAVTYGSGHVAINAETNKSWAAVPYVKPLQTSFQNAWGTVLTANEEDVNIDDVQAEPYSENI